MGPLSTVNNNLKQIRKHGWTGTFWLLVPSAMQTWKTQSVKGNTGTLCSHSISRAELTKWWPAAAPPLPWGHWDTAAKRGMTSAPYLLKLFSFFLEFLFQRTSGTFCILSIPAQSFSQFVQFVFQCSVLTANKKAQYKTKCQGKKSYLWHWKNQSQVLAQFTIVFWHFLS